MKSKKSLKSYACSRAHLQKATESNRIATMADEEQQPQPNTTNASTTTTTTDDSAKTYLESTVTKVLHDALVELNEKRPNAPVRFLVDYLAERAERVDEEIAARRPGGGTGGGGSTTTTGNA